MTEDTQEQKETNIQGESTSSKFAKDIIWVGMAQLFVFFILGIVTLPALTKYYASDIYGIWIQINITIELMAPVVSLQLGLAAVRFLADEENIVKRRRSLGAMLSAIAIFAAIISVASIPFAKHLSIFLFASSEYIGYIWLLIIWVFFNTVYNFLLSYLQARSNNRGLAIIRIVINTLKVSFIIGLAVTGFELEAIVISQILLQAFFSLVILLMVTKSEGLPIPGLVGLRTFLAFSIPQIPVFLFLWIIRMGDRYFVTHFLGLSQDGIYSSSASLANLALLFSFPISFVLFAITSRLWEQKRVEDIKIYHDYSLKLFLALAIPGLVGITMLSQPLLQLLTTSEFLAGKELVFLLALGVNFLGIYQINTNIILMVKRGRLLPLIVLAGAIINIIMNYILVQRVGIIGAAYASFTAYFVIALISTVWARSIIRYHIDIKFIAKVIASALLMWICLNYLSVDGVWGILLAMTVGAAVFGIGILVLKAFSKEDIQLAKKIFRSFTPKYRHEKPL